MQGEKKVIAEEIIIDIRLRNQEPVFDVAVGNAEKRLSRHDKAFRYTGIIL